ncbi:MAG TPA: 4Fe-4S binding protein [Bacillota bacterium]|jgi:ferredoxin
MPAKIIESLCTGCRTCERNCPAGAISVVAGRARVDPALCTECETCVENCMQGALTMVAAKDSGPTTGILCHRG